MPINFKIIITNTAGNPNIATIIMVIKLYSIPKSNIVFTRYMAINPNILFKIRPMISLPNLNIIKIISKITNIAIIPNSIKFKFITGNI